MRSSHLLLVSLIAAATAGLSCKGEFGFAGDPFVPEPPGPRPQYGATVTQAESPRPISGGTLLVVDVHRAVVADPDRDAIVVVDLAAKSHRTIALNKGDDPGRATLDGGGRVHVVLRGGNAIATIDLASLALTRTTVCQAPRGITFDAVDSVVRVACADGHVVALAKDLAVSETVTLDRDLRDIVMNDAEIWISHFRSANVTVIDRKGNVLRTTKSPTVLKGGPDASVAWRMLRMPSGGVAMIHQRGRDPNAPPVKVSAGGYTAEGGAEQGSSSPPTGSSDPPLTDSADGGPPPLTRSSCKLGIVQSSLTRFFSASSVGAHPAISTAVLPVDLAISPLTNAAVVVAAGNGYTKELDTLFLLDGTERRVQDCAIPSKKIPRPEGQPVAAGFDPSGRLVVQVREPATLVVYDAALSKIVATIPYGEGSREDTGHAIFHANSGGFLACASCHPEGGDDGRVWAFENVGARRTQNLRGGVRAPFHWNGELADLRALTGEVLGKRMSGPNLADDQLGALSSWINHVPAMPSSTALDATAVARGRTVFENSKCATCHSGPAFTNAAVVDVGTGGGFKVPSLRGLAWRAPYMHNGCANGIDDRFRTDCGGAAHGPLTFDPSDLSDLVAFLQSL